MGFIKALQWKMFESFFYDMPMVYTVYRLH